ncbi:phasin family protein [Isoalcanivorax indicus]|uniref:phasin family protein n=1 Tax=Isoalcanivorax indicus TaxID=2202653 RepID=UPI000DBAA3E5|nr:phasin family protein [Isoalcanivorax indicus]
MPQLNKESLDQAREELTAARDKAIKALRGAVSRAEQRGNDLFQELVKAGEALQKERAKAQSKVQGKVKAQKASAESTLDTLRQRTAELLGLPTRDDVDALNKKLNSLTRKVRKIEKATADA